MWLPRFVCPACHAALDDAGPGGSESPAARVCARCGTRFERRDGVWRFLSAEREQGLAPFVRQYRAVRAREGRTSQPAAHCRSLPDISPADPHASEWRIRQETYRHLLRCVLATGKALNTILDLGAGSCWLAHRLSLLGHHVVAVDAIDDEPDGLGAVRRYETPIVAIQADFDALPLARAEFDIVVFNGSLHYAPDAVSTLARARQMLAADGTIVVMDSPMFRAEDAGAAMVADASRRFETEYGLRDLVRPGSGYLTFGSLAASASALNMETAFVPSRGPLGWRVRRQLSRIRLGREPASFGLWMAR